MAFSVDLCALALRSRVQLVCQPFLFLTSPFRAHGLSSFCERPVEVPSAALRPCQYWRPPCKECTRR